jgi:hypothetical protein
VPQQAIALVDTRPVAVRRGRFHPRESSGYG